MHTCIIDNRHLNNLVPNIHSNASRPRILIYWIHVYIHIYTCTWKIFYHCDILIVIYSPNFLITATGNDRIIYLPNDCEQHICTCTYTDLGLQWSTNSKKDNFQFKKVFFHSPLPCIMITNKNHNFYNIYTEKI